MSSAARCCLHLVDGTSSTVTRDYRSIVKELEAYSAVLGDKPRILALNKIDALTSKQVSDRRRALEKASGGPVHMLFGRLGAGRARGAARPSGRDLGRHSAEPEEA